MRLFASKARCGPIPLRFAYLGRSAGSGLRSHPRRKARGKSGVRSAPTGHRIPARGETPGMAHKRSVLKERRIPPGAITCFAVTECRGWRWGSVPRGGSAGTVLRSQGTWRQARLSRCRAMGNRVSTFQCSLRPGPAPPSVFVGSAGPVLRTQEGSEEDRAFALCARDLCDRLQCSLWPDPATAMMCNGWGWVAV